MFSKSFFMRMHKNIGSKPPEYMRSKREKNKCSFVLIYLHYICWCLWQLRIFSKMVFIYNFYIYRSQHENCNTFWGGLIIKLTFPITSSFVWKIGECVSGSVIALSLQFRIGLQLFHPYCRVIFRVGCRDEYERNSKIRSRGGGGFKNVSKI